MPNDGQFLITEGLADGFKKTWLVPVNNSVWTCNSSGELALVLISSLPVAAHASTHAAAGSDPITISQSQVTSLVSDLSNKQPLDEDLTTISAMTATGFVTRIGPTGWNARSIQSDDIVDASDGGNASADAGKVSLYSTGGAFKVTNQLILVNSNDSDHLVTLSAATSSVDVTLTSPTNSGVLALTGNASGNILSADIVDASGGGNGASDNSLLLKFLSNGAIKATDSVGVVNSGDNSTSYLNAQNLTADQVAYLPDGTGTLALTGNADGGITVSDITDFPMTFPPEAHAASHAFGGSDEVSISSVQVIDASAGGNGTADDDKVSKYSADGHLAASDLFELYDGGGDLRSYLTTSAVVFVNPSNPTENSAVFASSTYGGASQISTGNGYIALTSNSDGTISPSTVGIIPTNYGGLGADNSASSGVPLFASGVNTFTGTSGTGDFARVTSPTFVTPNLGTPSTLVLTSATGLPLTTGVTGTLPVANGGTGRATSTTAYGLIAAGTTATGAHQTLAAGATTQILVGGGASALPVWTTATGSGAPVRATSPALVTPDIGAATGTSAYVTGQLRANTGGATCLFGGLPTGLSVYGGFWVGTTSPSDTNYSLLAGNGQTLFNASGSIEFRIGNMEKMKVFSTGGVSVGTSTDPGAGNLLVNGNLKSAGFAQAIVSKTSAYTATATDYTIICDATSAAFTVTLPAAASHAGRIYVIKKIDASANAVTIDPNASETIDGAATWSIGTQYTSVQIQSNGTNWFIISGYEF